MFLFNIQTKNHEIIRFERDVTNNKVTTDKLRMIKAIRDIMHCGLSDAKNFCDLVISELNRLDASPDAIRHQVRDELNTIHDSNELLDILRFVRTVKDHPMPDNGHVDAKGHYHPPLSPFTESGEYKPF